MLSLFRTPIFVNQAILAILSYFILQQSFQVRKKVCANVLCCLGEGEADKDDGHI